MPPLTSSLDSYLELANVQIAHFITNMWILPALGYVGVILGFAFLTLAIGKLVHLVKHITRT